ncbi:hypothetical protein WJX81_006051 [Elliptochloris bilobata]|uniref:Uncharacterized protein n=1 Tax=Elliptochloris bilobata TaxID=381761 RepID=A0AAW1RH71_9CHLO
MANANDQAATFNPQTWKEARDVFVRQLIDLLQSPCKHKRLVLVDDNNHYRSMRAAYYRLARMHGAAFIQLHLSCKLGPTQASQAAPHLLDLHCRRVIGGAVAALPGAAAKREASPLLNAHRKALLARCKASCASQDGSINTSAMDIDNPEAEFDAQCQALLRTLGSHLQEPDRQID